MQISSNWLSFFWELKRHFWYCKELIEPLKSKSVKSLGSLVENIHTYIHNSRNVAKAVHGVWTPPLKILKSPKNYILHFNNKCHAGTPPHKKFWLRTCIIDLYKPTEALKTITTLFLGSLVKQHYKIENSFITQPNWYLNLSIKLNKKKSN